MGKPIAAAMAGLLVLAAYPAVAGKAHALCGAGRGQKGVQKIKPPTRCVVVARRGALGKAAVPVVALLAAEAAAGLITASAGEDRPASP